MPARWIMSAGKLLRKEHKVYADTRELSITIARNCHRCGREYRATPSCRVCTTCRKPRVRAARPVSKHLTLRQNQLVDLIIQGKLNKEIAYHLHLSEGTIKTYLSAIFDKLGVTNRTELAVWALTQRENAA